MKKKLVITGLLSLVIVACNKPAEKENLETQTSTTELIEDTDYNQAKPSTPGDTFTTTLEGEDGKAKLHAEFNTTEGLASLVYEDNKEQLKLKQIVTASGEVYANTKGDTLTIHQGKFTLTRHGKNAISGKMK